nr:hypothetical protein [Tanacetum cinerariifolium]
GLQISFRASVRFYLPSASLGKRPGNLTSRFAPPPTPTPTMIPSTITTITTATQAPIPPTPIPKMELKKILIEKMEGNKSIQCFDEQRNLYKALVEAYEADKIILDTYGERVILNRRRDDDDDQGEGPSAGSDRGLKRQREGKEFESTCALLEPATRLKNPHIRCLKQVQKINLLFKLLSIMNGSLRRRNLQLRIVTGTRPCQLFKEALRHG